MEIIQLINEIRQKSDSEVEKMAKSYNIPLSKKEISRLRPLLNQFSLHWLITGVPSSVMQQVEAILGAEKTKKILGQLKQYR